jgi:hypothetical protein
MISVTSLNMVAVIHCHHHRQADDDRSGWCEKTEHLNATAHPNRLTRTQNLASFRRLLVFTDLGYIFHCIGK